MKSAELIRIETEPEKIILFGSFAKGCANLRSDVDFLVIGDFSNNRHERSMACGELAFMFPVGFDLHFVTPEEIAPDLEKPGSFYYSAVHSGHVIYTRNDLPESG